MTEHKLEFLTGFRLLQITGRATPGVAILCNLVNVTVNFIALFCVFFIIGRALKLGLGV